MPFDNIPITTNHTLAELSEILRDKSRWPEGFVWDYGHCQQCAMGLAAELWADTLRLPHHHFTIIARYFNMPFEKALEIFCHLDFWKRLDEITPERVADAIDAYLAERS